jgi:DNA-binding GntR family transcriptional regulator
MLVLRAHLEHLALRLAFARAANDIFAGVSSVSAEMTRMARSARQLDMDVWADFSLLDAQFHTRLVQASGSSALLRAWETVAPTDFIFLFDQTRPLAFTRAELQGMAARHNDLVRALLSGDSREAQTELRTHFLAASRGGTVSLDERSLELLDWDHSTAREAATR